MIGLDLNELRGCFGLGVAGNVAGHLEQAGEHADFAHIGEPGVDAPKGIFPVYVPGDEGFLGDFPFSHDRISKPPSSEPVNLQIEPEVGLICDIEYSGDGLVAKLSPAAVAAFNDCSIRRPGAIKISVKKNWGADSKGVARSVIPVTEVNRDGETKSLRVACFLRRGDETDAYGVDTPVGGYSYYGDQLLEWMVDRLNSQKGSPDSPLEPVGEYLRRSGSPASMVIGIGATRYTELGETTFLNAGDESIVVVYDGAKTSESAAAAAISERRDAELVGASILRQIVYDAAS